VQGRGHRFSDITPDAFAELAQVTRDIETGLAAFRPYDKINYLMLMMVDPDVHFHVMPRYGSPQTFEAVEFPDAGWPGPPQLGTAVSPEPDCATGFWRRSRRRGRRNMIRCRSSTAMC
jgi:diadenosine tetraphosphate (Ap4A) HIT family hydrolase